MGLCRGQRQVGQRATSQKVWGARNPHLGGIARGSKSPRREYSKSQKQNQDNKETPAHCRQFRRGQGGPPRGGPPAASSLPLLGPPNTPRTHDTPPYLTAAALIEPYPSRERARET
jgi:hypothetical protein